MREKGTDDWVSIEEETISLDIDLDFTLSEMGTTGKFLNDEMIQYGGFNSIPLEWLW